MIGILWNVYETKKNCNLLCLHGVRCTSTAYTHTHTYTQKSIQVVPLNFVVSLLSVICCRFQLLIGWRYGCCLFLVKRIMNETNQMSRTHIHPDICAIRYFMRHRKCTDWHKFAPRSKCALQIKWSHRHTSACAYNWKRAKF